MFYKNIFLNQTTIKMFVFLIAVSLIWICYLRDKITKCDSRTPSRTQWQCLSIVLAVLCTINDCLVVFCADCNYTNKTTIAWGHYDSSCIMLIARMDDCFGKCWDNMKIQITRNNMEYIVSLESMLKIRSNILKKWIDGSED